MRRSDRELKKVLNLVKTLEAAESMAHFLSFILFFSAEWMVVFLGEK